MSWWTFVDFAYVAPEEIGDTREFEIEHTRAEIEMIVDAQRCHRDAAKDMSDLIVKKHADFKLNSFAVIDLFSTLAARFPDVSFAIRGRGEDIREIWIREFAGGRNTFAFGPPEGVGY
jgi:hypothetical protein